MLAQASIVLLTFNNECHVATALRSAFAQTYRPLEIVVSNDAGSDAAWRIVETVAAECPPDICIVLNRNAANMGIGAHFCLAAEMAGGDVIVAFAEDDISLPQRVALTMKAFEDESVMAVAVGHTLIDDAGAEIGCAPPPTPHDVESLARTGQAASNGAVAAYRRSVFSDFAPIAQGIVQEDVILFFRAALLGRIAIVPERLVLYRQHADSVTGSTGPRSVSADAFARRLRQYVESLVRVRAQQMADAVRMHAPGSVLLGLALRAKQEELYKALIRRDLPGLLVRASAVFHMPPRDAARAIARHAAPRLWYWWISRRAHITTR
jgi:glycosyltransferase involved in cell wall biosynthesis